MNREEILKTTIGIVMKDRNATHGNPEDNFASIAEYWSTFLQSKGLLTTDQWLKGDDVAAMMILQKVSRMAKSPEHPDHWVDTAGYAACGGQIATSRKPKKDLPKEASDMSRRSWPQEPDLPRTIKLCPACQQQFLGYVRHRECCGCYDLHGKLA